MRTSSAMMKSWHRRDFLKSHKNNRSARSLCHVGDGRLLFFDGFEVNKSKMELFIPSPTARTAQRIRCCSGDVFHAQSSYPSDFASYCYFPKRMIQWSCHTTQYSDFT